MAIENLLFVTPYSHMYDFPGRLDLFAILEWFMYVTWSCTNWTRCAGYSLESADEDIEAGDGAGVLARKGVGVGIDEMSEGDGEAGIGDSESMTVIRTILK